MGHIKTLLIPPFFSILNFYRRVKNPPKLGAELNFCDFRLGSRKHGKKTLHSHSCFPFVRVFFAGASDGLPCMWPTFAGGMVKKEHER